MGINIIDHPLIQHKLAIIRDIKTNSKDFRSLVSEVGSLLTYEVCKNFQTKKIKVTTPVAEGVFQTLATEVVIVPILRAGLGMVEGIINLIPNAHIGHIGLYRDEKTLEPIVYYQKFPKELKEAVVLLVDPMLATGNSAKKAVEILKAHGAKEIIYVGLVGAPQGANNLSTAFPEVEIFLAAMDSHLNEKGYIVPGLGDCGDRLFGTK
ncbi:MAG: uracil phosphoribosyltransferase [Acholeplasmatales bacterium]|jgi:uracil phosphoribosyltransferase|nr:uracil phosphoribosyltransferase [Acholeplasmatales bacterium]